MEAAQSAILLKTIEFLKTVLPYVLPVITLLAGYFLGIRQLKAKKKLDFMEQQLKEFYSPLLRS